MQKLAHKILYKCLPLGGYLRVVSRMFFIFHRLGIGKHSKAMEYVYHLPNLVKQGDTAIDIGANLGYYSRIVSKIIGAQGHLFAVEPVKPIAETLRRNLKGCDNIEILNYALGTENKTIVMGNDSTKVAGYFGTGQNFVNETEDHADVEFSAQMRRGSELFGNLNRLDFVKCDIEGYEVVVMTEMRGLLEKFHPTVLIETGADNRTQIVKLFTELGYRGFTLEQGSEIPLTTESYKDIIFRYFAG